MTSKFLKTVNEHKHSLTEKAKADILSMYVGTYMYMYL